MRAIASQTTQIDVSDISTVDHSSSDPVPPISETGAVVSGRISNYKWDIVRSRLNVLGENIREIALETSLNASQIINLLKRVENPGCRNSVNHWNIYGSYYAENIEEEFSEAFPGVSPPGKFTALSFYCFSYFRAVNNTPIRKECYSIFQSRFSHWRDILETYSMYKRTVDGPQTGRSKRDFEKNFKKLRDLVCIDIILILIVSILMMYQADWIQSSVGFAVFFGMADFVIGQNNSLGGVYVTSRAENV